MNKDDKELYGGIYKLCETGMEATKTVMPKVTSKALKNELEEQYNDYSEAKAAAEQAMVSEGVMPQENSIFSKAVMWGSIQMNTLTESSSDHIAEIMINGTTMGVVDLTKHIGACKNADDSTIKYAKDFIKKEEKHIDNLKAFLC